MKESQSQHKKDKEAIFTEDGAPRYVQSIYFRLFL